MLKICSAGRFNLLGARTEYVLNPTESIALPWRAWHLARMLVDAKISLLESSERMTNVKCLEG